MSDIYQIDYKKICDDVAKSETLGNSERQKKLFDYLLSQSLLKPDEEITEYGIAFDVFGRGSNFDPRLDSCVRSEIYRLRKNLSVFNASRKDYNINLPRGSYNLIVKKIENSPRKLGKLGLSIPVLIFTLSSVLLASLYMFTLRFRPAPKIETTFVPTISVEAVSKDSKTSFPDLEKKLSENLHYILSNHALAILVNDKAQYHVKIDVRENEDAKSYDILFNVYDHTGKLIWKNNYLLEHEKVTDTSLFNLAGRFYNAAFNQVGVITHYHANNEYVPIENRNLYRCYIDAQGFTLDAPRYTKEPLLKCLNPQRTSYSRDKSRIHLSRANLYLGSYLGNYDEKLPDPLKNAYKELELSQKYNFNSFDYLKYKLWLERIGRPKNKKEIKRILDLMGALYSGDSHSDRERSVVYAELFGDWETALPLIEETVAGDTAPSYARIPYIYYYMVQGDWQKAQYHNDLIPANKSAINAVLNAVIACRNGLEDRMPEIRLALEEKNLLDPKLFTHYVRSRHMYPVLEDILTQESTFATCPIFR